MPQSNTFYIRKGERIIGPLNSSEVRQLAREKRISPETEVRFGEGGPWMPASRVKSLAQEFAASADGRNSESAEPTGAAPLPIDPVRSPAGVAESLADDFEEPLSTDAEPEPSDVDGDHQPFRQSHHELQRKLSMGFRSPLLEWGVSALVMLSVLGWLTWRHLLSALKSDGTGLCIVIVVLFLAALIKNWYDATYVQYEMWLSNRQLKKLLKINNINRFLRSSRSSLLRDHLVNLYEISKRDSTVSQDNLVALLQSRLYAMTKLSDVASSLLVTLGLVGTIMGLITAVGGLGTVIGDVGSEDKTQILSGMNETIGGMGTAFYTTLLGALLGGITLRVLTNVVDSHVDKLVAHIAELAEVYVIPTLRQQARVKLRDS